MGATKGLQDERDLGRNIALDEKYRIEFDTLVDKVAENWDKSGIRPPQRLLEKLAILKILSQRNNK
jgi:hypothetical protein